MAAAYFEKLQEDPSNNIVEAKIQPSGNGADGGRDILVVFRVSDSLTKFERKWVVQCKFYKDSVSAKKLITINIPSLIHQYNADGYLLICKEDTTSGYERYREHRHCLPQLQARSGAVNWQ